MSVTSGNPDDPSHFVSRGAQLRGSTESEASSVAASASAVRAASADYQPQTAALARCGELLAALRTNELFVQVVRDALVQADLYGGSPAARDASIELALSQHGLLGRPAVVEVARMDLYGIPPTSGFVDDPICAANGNFVHGDEDLPLPGFAAALTVVRVYNSLGHGRRGAFGWGWASVLDRRVDAENGLARVSLADGAVVPFAETEDGYEPDTRRGLTLERAADGWTLREGQAGWWRFDAAGELAAFGAGVSQTRVERAAGEVRLTEAQSGRWVRRGNSVVLHGF